MSLFSGILAACILLLKVSCMISLDSLYNDVIYKSTKGTALYIIGGEL